jgi:hypothetical protein
MDPQKSERVGYRSLIQDFRSFSQSETQKLSSVQLLFCPEKEISSKIDLQNSVTSKPFGGQSCMSNRWKAGRICHVYDVQLWDRIITKLSCFHFFLTAICISREI